MMGCFALVRDGDGWRSTFDGACLSWSDVRAKLAELPAWRGPFFAEELLTTNPVEMMDWKFYAFDGIVPLVYQETHPSKDRSRWRRKFWRIDGDNWTPIGGAGLYMGREVDARLPRPRNPEALLDIARKVSQAVASPFVRVDCYETALTAVLGEVSLTMGRPQIFTPDLDEVLGKEWEAAEVRRFRRAGF